MQLCPQCGMSGDEGAVRCSHCGSEFAAACPPPEDMPPAAVDGESTPPPVSGVEPRAFFCFRCGNELPLGAHVCGVCGTVAPDAAPGEEIIPVSRPYYKPQEEPDQQMPPKNRRGVVIGVLCAVAVLLVFCCIGICVSIPASTPEVAGEEPVIYVQNDETLKYKTSSMEKAETITDVFDLDTDYYSSYYSSYYGRYSNATVNDTQLLSEDGRYLLYLNSYRERGYGNASTGDLFLRDLSKHTTDSVNPDRGVKIASNVTNEFMFSGDERQVIFLNGKKELFAWDFSEAYKLDSDVTGILDWNAEQVLYYKGDETDEYTSHVTDRDVFVIPLQKNSPNKVKIDTNINDVWDWNDDFTKFIYTKTSRSASQGSVLFSVYAFDLPGDARKLLISDVSDIVDANAEDGSLLYLIGREGGVSLSDILEDDMLEQDALIEEPDISQFPVLDEYYGGSGYYDWYRDYEDYYSDYYSDYYGDYYGDYESDDEDYYGSYGSDNYGYSDYADLLDEWDEYSALLEEYEAKLERDKLREKMHDQVELYDNYSTGSYDLYYLKDGERKKLDGDIYRSTAYAQSYIEGDIEKNYTIYLKAIAGELEQLKFSEIYKDWYYYSFDIQDYIDESITKLPYIALLDGTTMPLSGAEPADPTDLYDYIVTDELDGIYYLLGDEDTYDDEYMMYYIAFSEEKGMEKPVLVDDNVECFSAHERYQGGYLYTSVPRNGKQDLYVVKNGVADRLGYDVSSAIYVYSFDDTLVFFENYNSYRETGDFCIMRDEKIVVADDVYDFFYRRDDLIYLLRNYNDYYGKGDLYVYNGETVELVDYEVTDIMGAWW